MLNQNLIDIINSGETWAFVGSGCSVDAGLPTWEELVEKSLLKAQSEIGPLPSTESTELRKYLTDKKLPEAFSVLKKFYGSVNIDSIVSSIFNIGAEPGAVTKLIANWPFASYFTSNYDDLLERTLTPFGGWIPIGNTSDENSKISGDVKKVIWHPHGGATLGNKNSRLVLASTDYDEIYSAGSPTLAAMDAICRMKRLVFIGFGFRDPDLVMTLQKIARLITPSRPAFGFFANCTQREREDYWQRYKIEIIPYTAKGNDHSDILNVLNAYSSFILDRTTPYGRIIATPDYDNETVSLLTHNRIVRAGWSPEKDAVECIAKGHVITQLKSKPSITFEQLVGTVPQRSSQLEEAMRRVVASLITNGDIANSGDFLKLTVKGEEFARQGQSDYELVRDQFRQSILTRANENCRDKSLLKNIQEVTVNYLEKTCRERGLGVAQQLVGTVQPETRARAVALLQGVKSELTAATNREAAHSAIHCIWEVLNTPRPEEKRHLGLLTQAYFGRQLLGADPASIGIQYKNLGFTVFIADSNFLIPLLAEGSIGHQYALKLYEKLAAMKCGIVTSDLLLEECVEHARWTWDLLNKSGSTSNIVIDAAKCARGFKPNAFLNGYLNHPEFGPNVSSKRYFAKVFNCTGDRPDEASLIACLMKKGIVVQSLSAWRGFNNQLWSELENVQGEIEQRRRRNSTYKHERQVKAEAEVAVIVTRVRMHELSIESHDSRDAYFLSHSRVVDNLQKQAQRVCLTPESLFDWILSIGDMNDADADAVYDQLLWELSRSEVNVVPRQQLLRLFHNTIDASKEKLDEIISEHREIIREKYSEAPEKAFLDIDPLNIPSITEEISRDVLAAMQSRLALEQQRRATAEAKAKSAIKDTKEFERLKMEKKQRQDAAKRKQRAAVSKPKKKKKK